MSMNVLEAKWGLHPRRRLHAAATCPNSLLFLSAILHVLTRTWAARVGPALCGLSLQVIAAGAVRTGTDVGHYIKCTLLSATNKDFQKVTNQRSSAPAQGPLPWHCAGWDHECMQSALAAFCTCCYMLSLLVLNGLARAGQACRGPA